MDPSLSELLERAKLLENQVIMQPSDLLPAQLTLPELLRETEKMHSRLTSQQTDKLRAIEMFKQHGIDIQQLMRQVQHLDMQRIIRPDEQQPDTDVAGLLTDQQQAAIMEIVGETNKNIFRTIEKRGWQSKFEEWEMEKNRLINEFAQQDPACGKAMTTTTSTLNCIQQLYAKEIVEYNKCQQRVNLLTTFTKLAEQQLQDEKITRMWQVLDHMAKQSPLHLNGDVVKARKQSPLFMQQAHHYLELAFRQHIDGVLKRSKGGSDCGGIPRVYHKIKRFVHLKVQEWPSLNGLHDVLPHRCRLPLWPHVFYSLRCGDLRAAVQFLKDWGDPWPNLREFFEIKHNAKLCSLKLRLTNDYTERLSNCSDPFLKAVFALVLACDLNNPHSQVLQSLDDFVWSQLLLRRELQKPLGIPDVEGMMHLMYGSNYLNDVTKIPIFFQLLVLTGHFEAAIEFLSRTEANKVHAVHMAISLNELSLLGIASNELDPMLGSRPDDVSNFGRLNVMRLIMNYAKRFQDKHIVEAINYYYLLRQYPSNDGCNLLVKCCCEFMLSNFKPQLLDMMFGKPQSKDPALYVSGVFDRLPGKKLKYELAARLAQDLTERCEYQAAIEMHLITGQLDKAMGLMCSLLAQMLHLNTPKESLRKLLSKLTNRLNSGCTTYTSSHELIAFKLLSQLMQFFDCFYGGDYQKALHILDASELLPKNCMQIDFCVSKSKVLGADAIKVLPNVLLATMEIYFKQFTNQKTLQSTIKLLRERAKALINFAGTIPHRLPPSITKPLLKMDLQMQLN